MSKTMKRVGTAALAVAMTASVCAVAAGCGDNSNAQPGQYTYRTATTALANNWNPHTWETNADQGVLLYLSQPFVDMSIKDSENSEYQWVYEMATKVTDVTKEHQSDLTKYGVTLQAGKTAETTESGFVFEIALNPDAKWENGEEITADDYIYSMQQLLNSKMRNYRANLYIAGESALAGAAAYYDSEAPIYSPIVPAYGENDTPDYSFDLNSQATYIHLTSTKMTLSGYSIYDIYDMGYIRDVYDEEDPTKLLVPGETNYKALAEKANAYGYIEMTAENKELALVVMDQYLSAFGMSIYDENGEVVEGLYKEFLFYNTGKFGEKVNYDDTVGCYKVDDYTIRYVNQTYIDYNYFMSSLTSTWLVYEDLYEAGKDTTGTLVTTDYGTSIETTMSYGVYKLESFQEEKQMVFVQNENWYGFEKDENGKLVSYTDFEVDGEKKLQYQTTRVVIDVLTLDAMKQAFLKGELTEWEPAADELSTYALSDQLYRVDETYTMSFFFNTNLNTLKKMDASKGNTNSVVLSNINFRKAFSLAIDRADFVVSTPGYNPAYSLMNDLYFYDVYNDPTSQYRSTDEAMQAICNLYGVKYGEGEAYKTLEEAYNSINGYNLTEAKVLMKTACEELVAAGIYKEGEPITIKIAWAKGALTSDDNAQLAKIQKYLNAAVEGSGFGTIKFEAVGNLNDRYGDVSERGEYAIGYGAWGGAAFYPFRNFQVYMDPDQYDINEAGCYDPKTETLTLTVNGQEETMTWQDWSNCLIGSGKYSAADFATKLSITAQLEEAFLSTYYRIPLCDTTACTLLSYQCSNYTETYNIMYGFGGLRLMTYNYDDAEWADFVKKQGGQLNYT